MNLYLGSTKSYYVFECGDIKLNNCVGATCFASAVNSFSEKILRDIKITIKIIKANYSNNNLAHGALVNESEMRVWFGLLASIFPFEYYLQDMGEFYLMEIKFKKANAKQFLWVMIGIRNVYESKNSIFLKEAFSLIKYELVSTPNIIDLFKILYHNKNFSYSQTWFISDALPLFRTIEESQVAVAKLQPTDFVQYLDYTTTGGYGNYSITHVPMIDVYGDYSDKIKFDKDSIFFRYINHHLKVLNKLKKLKLLPNDFQHVEKV